MAESRRGFFQWLTWLLSYTAAARGRDKSPGEVDAGSDSDGPSAATHVADDKQAWYFDEPIIRRHYDLVVVGGGIAGVCAAISAARNGVKVALVHNRAMLGGNSSSEVKLFPENNAAHQPWIKEGGIHEELHTEERVRNHRAYVEGTMNCHWDLVLYEWVIREKNIELYLNTHMYQARMRRRSAIECVLCLQLGTEKVYELHAPLFVDATGDGYLGFRSGAEFRWGREGRDEYGEPEAPPQADERVMGNTLMFTAIDTGRPVPFRRPEWSAEFRGEDSLVARGHQFIEGGYWWIEVGAPHHPIADNDKICHEGLRQLLGVWDHIKNQCKDRERAANYGLEFVGFWPYKRECRRILGDFVITQSHIQNPQVLPDAVAYGAWGIDIHTQGGILSRRQIPYEPPGEPRYWDRLMTLPYGIPLRALYSRNVENLMMAGRPISCSYVAFASSRVLSTGSIVGQAVGVAAALCKKYRATPRVVARQHAKECQQRILRDDGHIPGVVNDDPYDLARQATATASSEAALTFPQPPASRELRVPHAQIFPVSADRIDRIELMFYSRLTSPEKLRIGLRPAAHVWDFRAGQDLAAAEAVVPANQSSVWVSFPVNRRVEPGRLYYVYTEAKPLVHWKTFRDIDGQPNQVPVGVTPADKPGRNWRRITGGHCLIMRLHPESRPFGAQNVVRGTNRPDMWTNLWISDPQRGLPAWIQLTWPKPTTVNAVQITFDTDQNRRVTLPLFRYPDCVKDYSLEARSKDGWTTVAKVSDNYVRRRDHRFEPVQTDALRLTIHATNGARSARVYEIRAYHEV
jgi:hypothetical protein